MNMLIVYAFLVCLLYVYFWSYLCHAYKKAILNSNISHSILVCDNCIIQFLQTCELAMPTRVPYCSCLHAYSGMKAKCVLTKNYMVDGEM